MKRFAFACCLALCFAFCAALGFRGAVYAAPFAYIPSAEFQPTNDSTSVIDTATNTVVATIPNSSFAGYSLSGIAANCGGNAAYTMDYSGQRVCQIDTATYAVTCISVGIRPITLECVSQTDRLYAAGDDPSAGGDALEVIDTQLFQDLGTHHLGADAGGWVVSMAANPMGNQLYVGNYSGTVWVVDTISDAVSSSISFAPGHPNGLAVNPQGTRLTVDEYVPGAAGRLRVYNITASGLTSLYNYSMGTGSVPFGVALSSDGNWAYLADEGNDTLKVFTVASTGALTQKIAIPLPTGSQGQGVAVVPASISYGLSYEDIYVCLYVSNEVMHINYNKSTNKYTFSLINVVPSPSCFGKFITPFPAQ